MFHARPVAFRTPRSAQRPPSRLAPAAVLAVVGAVLGLGATAFAQLPIPADRITIKKSPRSQPAVKVDENAPLAERVLQQTRPRQWTVDVEVRIDQWSRWVNNQAFVESTPITFERAAFVVPMVTSSASSSSDKHAASITLRLNGRETPTTLALNPGFQSGLTLGRFDASAFDGREVSFTFTQQIDCANTILDDSLAATIPWPDTYPPNASSTFKPMMFVDYVFNEGEKRETDKLIAERLRTWLAGREPKSMPPLECIKRIVTGVMETVQVVGPHVINNQNGSIQGFAVNGTAVTLATGRGSEHDLVCVMISALRQAGLATRLVVGLDLADSKGALNPAFRGSQTFRSWAEVCLVDPVTATEIWLPVDIVALRRRGSRPPAIDRPWKYLGEHDQLEYLVPLSFQFHPPTSVIATGSPALWGWNSTPNAIIARQSIRYSVTTRATRGTGSQRTNVPTP
jgi:hypothetical protein